MRRFIKFVLPLTLFSIGAAVIKFPVGASDVAPLRLNAPLARQFKGGERHQFSVEARTGEALEIVADKKGIDIGLAAFAPNGEKIVISNAPGDFVGRETIFFIAEKSGRYVVEIVSKRPGDLAGEYTITLLSQNSSKIGDAERATAFKSLGAAREILHGAENRVGKAAEAIALLEKSLVWFEKNGDLPQQANALFHIAAITGNELGDDRKAAEIYEKAAEIWRTLGDEARQAVALAYAGNELRDGGNAEKSLEYLNQALALDQKSNDRPGEAITRAFLCRRYNNYGDFQKGFEMCRESLRLDQDADPLSDYVTYTNLAALYNNTGDHENSLKSYQTAAERAKLARDWLNPIRAANIQGNIGAVLSGQKKYAEAIPFYKEAIEVSEAVARPIYTSYYLAQLSENLLATGQPAKALAPAEKSLEIYRRHAPHKRQVALNTAGKCYAALGQNEKARELFSEALVMTRQNKDPYAEAETLYNLANIEKNVGNLGAAREKIGQAINISEILRAELLGKNQRTAYLAILKRYYELQIELSIALYEKNADVRFSEAAWQNQEKIRARSLFENFIESGLDLKTIAPEGFFTDEQKILRTIAEAALRRDEAAKGTRAVAQKTAEDELQRAFENYQILQENARRRNPRFAAASQPREFSFSEAQKFLDADTALLEFSLGEKQSYAWLVSRDSVKFSKLPARKIINQTARELYAALIDRAAKNEAATIEKSARLGSLIWQPFAADAAKFKKIIVVADGSLQLIPFAALPLAAGATEPLAENFEIVNAPSFASLVYQKESRANRRIAPDKRLAIFADPIFQADDERLRIGVNPRRKNAPQESNGAATLAQTLRDFGIERLARLPFSGIEAREIAQLAPAPKQISMALGAEASRQKFLRGDYNSHQILHFATHGFFNQQNPDLSGLVLSLYDENRQEQNGFLRVIDLYSLKLNADLVVLSACQTGLGKDVDGEGIVGLTRGFLLAGAGSVVSSLWKVEDAATAELMKRFYRAMFKENLSPAAALRRAQNELRRLSRWHSPHHWAGFMLTGNNLLVPTRING